MRSQELSFRSLWLLTMHRVWLSLIKHPSFRRIQGAAAGEFAIMICAWFHALAAIENGFQLVYDDAAFRTRNGKRCLLSGVVR